LDRMGMKDVELVVFGDHHEYSADDLARLRGKGEVLITTAKDAVKVDGVYVVEQRLRIEEWWYEKVVETNVSIKRRLY